MYDEARAPRLQRLLPKAAAIYFCNLFIGIRILPSKLGLAGLDLMVTPRFCFLFFFFFFFGSGGVWKLVGLLLFGFWAINWPWADSRLDSSTTTAEEQTNTNKNAVYPLSPMALRPLTWPAIDKRGGRLLDLKAISLTKACQCFVFVTSS